MLGGLVIIILLPASLGFSRPITVLLHLNDFSLLTILVIGPFHRELRGPNVLLMIDP